TPWSGGREVSGASDGSPKASSGLGIPGWARNQPVPGGLYGYADRPASQPAVSVNGRSVSVIPDSMGYVSLDRVWKTGDVVVVDLPVETRRVVADSRV